MAALQRLRPNTIFGTTLNDPLGSSDTQLSSAALALLPVVTAANEQTIVAILDPNREFGPTSEVILISDHAAGSNTTATITRAYFTDAGAGLGGQRSHPVGTPFVIAPTSLDYVQILRAANAPSSGVIDGTVLYVTDNNSPTGAWAPDVTTRPNGPGLYVYDERWNPPWNLPWGIVAEAQVTTTQSGFTTVVTDLTGLTKTFTHPANRRLGYLVEVPVSQTSASGNVEVRITDGSNNVIRRGPNTLASGDSRVLTLNASGVSTAGAQTVKARMLNTAGSTATNVDATQFCLLRIVDLGPSGAPA